MNSSSLVSRVMRVLITEGSRGDGPSVARDYAAAVSQANRRLRACLDTLVSRPSLAVLDALKSPDLLSECERLSLAATNQLAAWKTLCRDKGWQTGADLDLDAYGGLLAFCETDSSYEVLLGAYRMAAIKGDDLLLTRRCLYHLSRLPASDPRHREDLVGLEEACVSQLNQKYAEAFKLESDTTSDEQKRHEATETLSRIAEEALSAGWSTSGHAALMDNLQAWFKRNKKKLWREHLQEDVDLLRQEYVARNLSRVETLLADISAIQIESENTVMLPSTGRPQELLDEVTDWCRTERTLRAQQAVFDEHVRAFETAIATKNKKAILQMRKWAAFNHEVPAELMQQAKRVLRQILLRTALSFAGLTIMAVSIIGAAACFGNREYNRRCYARDKEDLLSRLEASQSNIPGLQTVLDTAEQETPTLFEDPDVRPWRERLSQLVADANKQRQDFDRQADRLSEHVQSRFANVKDDEFQTGLAQAKDVMPAGDTERRQRLAALAVAYDSYLADQAAKRASEATAALAALSQRAGTVIAQLQEDPLSPQPRADAASARSDLESWQNLHATNYTQLASQCASALSALADAEQAARTVESCRVKIDSSKTFEEWQACYTTLSPFCHKYPDLRPLSELRTVPYQDVLTGDLNVVKQTLLALQKDETVLTPESLQQLCADIKEYAGIQSQADMYAIIPVNQTIQDAMYYSLGQPVIRRADGKTTIGGVLLKKQNVYEGFKNDQLNPTDSAVTPAMMPHCKYLNALINKASLDVTAGNLSRFLLDQMRKVAEDQALTEYKRVQLLHIYFGYLNKLADLKGDAGLAVYAEELQSLAQFLRVGADESISWMITDNKDVQDREKACAKFLQRTAEIYDRINNLLLTREVWALMARQSPLYAGLAKLKGSNYVSFADSKANYGAIFALRKDKLEYRLRHVLTKTSEKFVLALGETNLTPGEPLFVFTEGGQITSLTEAVKELKDLYKQSGRPPVAFDYPPSWPMNLPVVD